MDALRGIIRERPRPVVAAVAVVLALVAGLATARGDRGPAATVRAFFDARRDGDCDRLLDLVSEASWSQGDRLDREGFVDECDEVVDAYGPGLDDLEVVRTGDDEAVVAVSVELDERTAVRPGAGDGLVVHEYRGAPATAHGTATLVQEQGRWRVETDIGLLRIGPSPNDTVAAYLEARTGARCDDVADLLSEDAWRAAGAASRGDFVERCQATSTPDEALGIASPGLRFELADHDGRITAVATDGAGFVTGAPGWTVTLVADGVRWRLERDFPGVVARGLRDVIVDPPIEGYTADIEDLVVPGVEPPITVADYEGTGAVEHRDENGFEGGAVVRFTDGESYITVLLYRFATPDGAGAYAEELARGVAAGDDDRAPPATTGGRFRTVVDCGDAGCSHAETVLAIESHGGYVVAVDVSDFIDPDPVRTDLLDRATAIVDAQLTVL